MVHSLLTKRKPAEYLVNRVLRIYPAFFVVIVLSAFMIGPMCTNLSMPEYFSDSVLWNYLKTNLSFHIFGNNELPLPGVFENNLYPFAVNTPIWAIGAEFHAYIVILALFLTGLLDDKYPIVPFVLLIFIAVQDTARFFPALPLDNPNFKYITFCYAVGGLFAIFKDRISINGFQIVGLFLLAQLMRGGWLFSYLMYLSIFILVMYISTRPHIAHLPSFPDLSYGIFLFAWPIQQALYHFFPNLPQLIHFLLDIFLSACLAFATNKLVEEPVLSLGRKLMPKLKSFTIH